MKKSLIGILLSTAFAAQGLAAPQTYQIDRTHTFPTISYNHMGFSEQSIRIDNTTGTIVYDKDAKTAEIDITLDMTSLSAGSPEFDESIRSDKLFDVEKFPTATFKSTKVNFEGDAPKTIDGELTIKDVTKAVTLEVTHFHQAEHPLAEKDAIGANAHTQVKRSDFGVDHSAPMVSDEVTINITMEAIAE